MLRTEMQETEESLSKIEKVCKLFTIVAKVAFVFICVWWIVAVFLMASVGSSSFSGLGILNILLYLVHGVVIASLLAVMISIFSDTARGNSPFTLLQVKRLRIMACLIVIYAVIDSIVMQSGTVFNVGGFDYGYVSPAIDTPIIQINLAPFLIAAAVYAFSFVFKYGVLLQRFTDETL